MKKVHLEVLVEDVNDKLQVLADGMSVLQDDMRQVKDELKAHEAVPGDIKAIKAAVTDQSRELKSIDHAVGDHESRLSALEQAA